MVKPLRHHEEGSRGGGGRGLGGPPPNVPYGGRAQQIYVPPAQRSAAPGAPASGKPPAASGKPAAPAAPASTKRQAASKSRYGTIAPLKPLAKAPVFESATTLSLDAKSDPNAEWQTYTGPDKGGGMVNSVSIQRSALPSPLPKKIKVKIEPA